MTLIRSLEAFSTACSGTTDPNGQVPASLKPYLRGAGGRAARKRQQVLSGFLSSGSAWLGLRLGSRPQSCCLGACSTCFLEWFQ